MTTDTAEYSTLITFNLVHSSMKLASILDSIGRGSSHNIEVGPWFFKSGLSCSVVAGVGFSPPRSGNLPFCHLGLLKGRVSSL